MPYNLKSTKKTRKSELPLYYHRQFEVLVVSNANTAIHPYVSTVHLVLLAFIVCTIIFFRTFFFFILHRRVDLMIRRHKWNWCVWSDLLFNACVCVCVCRTCRTTLKIASVRERERAKMRSLSANDFRLLGQTIKRKPIFYLWVLSSRTTPDREFMFRL